MNGTTARTARSVQLAVLATRSRSIGEAVDEARRASTSASSPADGARRTLIFERAAA